MGRPPTKPAKLKDGYYLELRNKGSQSGIKIRRDTQDEMVQTIKDYERSKDIVILGEYKSGKWQSDPKKHST